MIIDHDAMANRITPNSLQLKGNSEICSLLCSPYAWYRGYTLYTLYTLADWIDDALVTGSRIKATGLSLLI